MNVKIIPNTETVTFWTMKGFKSYLPKENSI